MSCLMRESLMWTTCPELVHEPVGSQLRFQYNSHYVGSSRVTYMESMLCLCIQSDILDCDQYIFYLPALFTGIEDHQLWAVQVYASFLCIFCFLFANFNCNNHGCYKHLFHIFGKQKAHFKNVYWNFASAFVNSTLTQNILLAVQKNCVDLKDVCIELLSLWVNLSLIYCKLWKRLRRTTNVPVRTTAE